MRSLGSAFVLFALAPLVLASTSCSAEEDEQVVSSGFVLNRDAFSFANYGNDNVVNLGPAEVRRIAGDRACVVPPPANDPGACRLTPLYQELAEEFNKHMDGGHCDGMSALAGIIYQGRAKAEDFGAPTTFDLKLAGNSKLQHEIAYLWMTQLLQPTRGSYDASEALGPLAIANYLENAFRTAPRADTFTLAIRTRGRKGGHAITPYAVSRKAGRTYDIQILVYDNNFPLQRRAVEVDSVANTWRYVGSTNPAEEVTEYEGDATSGNLGFVASSVRLQPQRCVFCDAADAAAAGALTGARQVLVSGLGHALITDRSGGRLGFVGDTFVDTIPDGSATVTRGFLDALQPDPFYELARPGFQLELQGSTLKTPSPVSVTTFGSGSALAVRDVTLAPGEIDMLDFQDDGRTVRYTSKKDRSPKLIAALQYAGADWRAEFSGGIPAGLTVEIGTDAATGKVRLRVIGQGSYPVKMQLVRAEDAADVVFDHRQLTLNGGDTAFFDLAAWPGNGRPMRFELDRASDGSIDATQDLADES
jgi:hypothetical protein